MKRLRRLCLPLFTLLLVAAGAAMPFATSRFQDAREREAEVRDFDSFSLTLRQETDLGRTLKLVAGQDFYIAENERAGEARMTWMEVLTAGEELMTSLLQYGLIDAAASSLPTVYPQVLCANDESGSIPTWTLDWNMEDGACNVYVWMDDAAGKAFLITLPCARSSSSYVFSVSKEPIYAQAENWRVFLENYYGTEVWLSEEEWFDYAARFTLMFALGEGGNGEQAVFQLDLFIYFTNGFATLSPYVWANAAIGNDEVPLPADSG